jgi:hypothetical protein
MIKKIPKAARFHWLGRITGTQINRVDQLMYKSKHTGRNRVTLEGVNG